MSSLAVSSLMVSSNPTDDPCVQLLQRIAQQDETAFAELYRLTRPGLASYVRRLVKNAWNAEEVLQDVYKYVWLNASAYHPGRGVPAAWLYTIARSRALDSMRRSRKDSSSSELDADHPRSLSAAKSRDGEADHARRWWDALLRRRVKELPGPQQEVVGLAFFEGYSHSEIADEMGLPLGTVKARIRTALNRLRQALPAQEECSCP